MALDHPEPAGPISCRIRSWGSPFRALLLPHSRTPFPESIPSWHWSRPRGPTTERTTASQTPRMCAQRQFGLEWGPQSTPRLQGFAPHGSPPPCSSELDQSRHVALLGLSSLQGVPPHWNGAGFPLPPLTWLTGPAANDQLQLHLRVSLPARLACPAKGLPTLLGFVALRHHSCSRRPRLGSHLLRSRGALPSPADHL